MLYALSHKKKTSISLSLNQIVIFWLTPATCFESVPRLSGAFFRVSPERPKRKTLRKNDTLDLSVGQVSVTVFSECIFLGKETVKETAVGDFFFFFLQKRKLNVHQSNSYRSPINLNFYVDYIVDKTNKMNSSDLIMGPRWVP